MSMGMGMWMVRGYLVSDLMGVELTVMGVDFDLRG